MTASTICIVITIVAYMIFMLLIGVYFSNKNKNSDDYYLGGRSLGPIVTAMSAEASDMSSWLLMGLPGLAFIEGLSDPAWTAIGLGIGTYVNWLVVAKRLRQYSHLAGNSITIPGFFKNRYHDEKGLLSGISALIILVFFVPYTASGFAACGKLFSKLFDVDYMIVMLVSAVVIVAYTMMGGFLAASTTDLIQSIIMTIALVIVMIFGVGVAGGLDQVLSNARAIPGYISLTEMGDVNTKISTGVSFLDVVTKMAWGLGYFGMPHILLRFMAIRDEKEIRVSRRIATVWVFISMAAAIFIGMIAYAMSQAGEISHFKDTSSAENSIIEIASLLSKNGVIVALAAGLILSGILACTMSTSDSQLLAAASSFSENILGDVFHAQMSERKKVTLARLTVVVIAVIGVFLARDPNGSVFKIVSFAWAGFGAAFGPLMLLSLYWRRTTKAGAIAGMISGGAMVFIWKYGVARLGGAFQVYELLPAFLVSLAVILVVSLLTPEPEAAVLEEFDQVASMK
jgi:sodium/proline symporter